MTRPLAAMRKSAEETEERNGMEAGRHRNFEDLRVYEQAREMTRRIYCLTRVGKFARDFGLSDQIRRAAVSVMSNIAEGFERGTRKEFVQFLFIAKGSCAEVRAQLSVALDQEYCGRADYDELVVHCRRLSGMLANLIKYLRRTTPDSRRGSPSPR